MCVGYWCFCHPDYSLIICSNRDEFLLRPTIKAGFHDFELEPKGPTSREGDGFVLSGRDVRAGGSWFGVNRAGRVAMLTNITEVAGQYDTSRGHLVSSFLQPSSQTLSEYVDQLVAYGGRYAGFNLLLLEPRDPHCRSNGESAPTMLFDARFVTNKGSGQPIISRTLSADERLYGGVSNGVDDPASPPWGKVDAGNRCMRDFLSQPGSDSDSALNEEELVNGLFDKILLYRSTNVETFERALFRNYITIPPTPLGSELYGTRTATVLLINRNGEVLFVERDVWIQSPDETEAEHSTQSGDLKDHQRSFRFHIPTNAP